MTSAYQPPVIQLPVIQSPAILLPPTKNTIHVMRPEGSAYLSNLSTANNIFSLWLHDCVGEKQYLYSLTGEQKVTSLWIRNDYGYNKSKDSGGQLNTPTHRNIIQIGGDIALWNTAGNQRFNIGIMARYGDVDSTTRASLSGHEAKSDINGYSLGVYVTWYANHADKSGLYLDGWLL